MQSSENCVNLNTVMITGRMNVNGPEHNCVLKYEQISYIFLTIIGILVIYFLTNMFVFVSDVGVLFKIKI